MADAALRRAARTGAAKHQHRARRPAARRSPGESAGEPRGDSRRLLGLVFATTGPGVCSAAQPSRLAWWALRGRPRARAGRVWGARGARVAWGPWRAAGPAAGRRAARGGAVVASGQVARCCGGAKCSRGGPGGRLGRQRTPARGAGGMAGAGAAGRAAVRSRAPCMGAPAGVESLAVTPISPHVPLRGARPTAPSIVGLP